MTVDFVDKLSLCDEARQLVKELYEKYGDDEEFIGMAKIIETDSDYSKIRETAELFERSHGVNRYEITLALLVTCLDVAKAAYDKRGIGEDLFYAFTRDLTFKCDETFKLHGVYGIHCVEWYRDFYAARRFSIGRLQFGFREFPVENYTRGGTSITKGEKCVDVHIPSDGRLDMSDCISAFKAAYEFFDDEYKKDGKLFIFCTSWLLYPNYLGRIFRRGTNVYAFARLFDIVKINDTYEFLDGWRVFNTLDFDHPERLPCDTSLRRALVDYIKRGESFGTAVGVVTLDSDGNII